MNTKIDRVKSFFAEPAQYLRCPFNIQIRASVIKEFVGDTVFESILDIGCGTGAISLPLLQQAGHLTLLDLSPGMLSIARAHVPVESSYKVDTVNDDFMRAELKPNFYDLIICVGVMAHVDSPINFLMKMISLLKPGGRSRIIVQNTDSSHPISYLFTPYATLRRMLLGYHYTLNAISGTTITQIFRDHGVTLSSIYRYSLPVPGMARVLSSDSLYKLIRQMYGTPTNKHFSWLGNECIYYFKKVEKTPAN